MSCSKVYDGNMQKRKTNVNKQTKNSLISNKNVL